MRLRHITFTGIDARTDLRELQAIQQQYPLAEFGVLTSYHWIENGNRYPNPQFLPNLWGSSLNLSLHLCGSAAHDAAVGEWQKIQEHVIGTLNIFKRIQLNIANRQDNPMKASLPGIGMNGQEIIIQQRSISDLAVYLYSVQQRCDPDRFSVLLDSSGGQGIDTPVEILKGDNKVGYAGGISPDNVADKLTYLFENVRDGEFWIDMESGVRTDDWFDTAKVRRVLEICEPIIKEYSNKEG